MSASLIKKLFLICWLVAAFYSLFLGNATFTGNFATKEICYAMIAKNFARNPLTFFQPTVDMLVNGRPSLHIVEFPWASYVVAIFEQFIPAGYEWWGRFLSWLLLPVTFFAFKRVIEELVRDEELALSASFLAVFSPLSLLYFRAFQMDSWAVTLLPLSLLMALRRGAGFSILFALLLLLKPHWAVWVWPIWIYRRTKNGKIDSVFWLKNGIAFIPAGLWIVWNFYLSRHSDAIYFSLTTSVNRHADLLTWWLNPLFYARILKIALWWIMNPVGFILILMSFFVIFQNKARANGFFLCWTLAFLLVMFALPKKFYEINYYLLPFIFPFGFYAARALPRKKIFLGGVLSCYFLITFFIIQKPTKFIPVSEIWAPEAGRYISEKTPKEARVVAVSGNSPCLLYYTDRQGWPYPDLGRESMGTFHDRLKKLIDQGASYFVTTDVDSLHEALEKDPSLKIHTVIFENQHYAVLALNKNA